MNEAVQIQQLRLFVFAALVLILFQHDVARWHTPRRGGAAPGHGVSVRAPYPVGG
ncbi:hypothetical protein ACN28S_28490 [Cystobacter fuscus]